MCLFVGLSVGLPVFYPPHDICPLCGAASEYSERAAKPSRAAQRARASIHSAESTRAHAVQLLNEKIAALMPFKNKTVRVHAVVSVTAEIFKKGKKKTNMPLSKFSLQFAFSWSVYFSNRTESYLISGRSRPWSARQFAFSWSVYFSNRTESYSSQIEFVGPTGITENQATYLHCGGEARAKKRARPPATC